MRAITHISCSLFFSFLFCFCNPSVIHTSRKKIQRQALDHYDSISKKLALFFDTLPGPKDGEWRYQFKEPYQSYRDYVSGKPVRADAERNIIYIQPLGELDSIHNGIISATAGYLHAFYGLNVTILGAKPFRNIPPKAKRVNNGQMQVLSTYVMFDVLKPELPDDAAALIAFTNVDLYPDEGWNFVFGQASYDKRIGVWSLARFGDPSAGKAAYKLCLERTFKTASHEMAHMFSIDHCVKYLCNMNGSLSLEESDSQPLWFCPECMCKICWNLGVNEKSYVERLRSYWNKMNEPEVEKYYESVGEKLK
ncbi:MAG TPA: archaemetzincin [Bacteroidia bacterium]